MELIDRIGEFLRRLSPLARSNLLTELERLEVCDAEIPGSAAVLEKLRAEFRASGQTADRAGNPSRYFFAPLEPVLADGAAEHANSGRILRGSLVPIWEWISRDLLPTMARDYATEMNRLIAADNEPGARRAASTFQTKVVKSLESMLSSSGGADQVRARLAIYTASRAAFVDLRKMLLVLRAQDALAKFNEALPATIGKFDDVRLSKVKGQLDAFRKSNPEEVPFALAMVAARLKTHWQLIRLATKAAPNKSAAAVAATPYAITVSMVLDRMEDKRAILRVALKNERILVAKELLTEIYDTEYALKVRIDLPEDSEWGQRLPTLMDSIAALVEAEVNRFPDNVGHVLGSRSLRSHESLAGRLTYLAWKGRDAVSGGAAYWKKLVS
jgi:hypothetical protein